MPCHQESSRDEEPGILVGCTSVGGAGLTTSRHKEAGVRCCTVGKFVTPEQNPVHPEYALYTTSELVWQCLYRRAAPVAARCCPTMAEHGEGCAIQRFKKHSEGCAIQRIKKHGAIQVAGCHRAEASLPAGFGAAARPCWRRGREGARRCSPTSATGFHIR